LLTVWDWVARAVNLDVFGFSRPDVTGSQERNKAIKAKSYITEGVTN